VRLQSLITSRINPAIEDLEMTQPEPHTAAVELCRLLPAMMANRVAVVGFNQDRRLAFIDDARAQDSNAGNIQQSLYK
jgi:hypothetical protein